ncbi:hypothetical protein C8R47DRAFT_1083586 [Mycena vitilis]|nr:hypothetical protein C8R47DRAFT_1083586 [Mycena vitilis]
MQINIYLQEGGATAGATESLKTITWVLLLAILAGIAMAGVNRQPAHPAIRRGHRGNYPVGNPVLQTLRGLIHHTGLLLLRVGRPQAQPDHPRCGHRRGPHPRGNNPRRITRDLRQRSRNAALEDTGVRAFLDDLIVTDPHTRSARLASEQNEPRGMRTMVHDNGAPYAVPKRRNPD